MLNLNKISKKDILIRISFFYFNIYFCNLRLDIDNINVPTINIVDNAFIVGVIPNLSIEYICIGKVSELIPVTKLVIT